MVGTLFGKLKEIQSFHIDAITQNTDHLPEFENLLNAKKNVAKNLIENLPPLEFFESLPLSCSSDHFFEVYVMQIKTTALSYQSFHFRMMNMKKDQLKKSISTLKQNFHFNQVEIAIKESTLANIVEQELKDELSLLKNFERLNN
jgi:hypothetical protein